MAEKKKTPAVAGSYRKSGKERGVIWPNPKSKAGTISPSGHKISARSGRVIANTSVDLSGALWRLADK